MFVHRLQTNRAIFLRSPVVQDHGLSDEALKSPLGDQGASAAGVQLVDPLQTK